MKVVALSGGVGGAKLVDGLAAVLPASDLTVIVNTGDDFDHLGLRICPDLDTVVYNLAGIAHPQNGWGRIDESWNFLETLVRLGGPDWFRIGDRDLALHIERSRRLQRGEPLSHVTSDLARRLGVAVRVLPMTEERVATIIHTDEGSLSFQDYFVARAWQPRVRGFEWEGSDGSHPAAGVLDAIQAAAVIIFGPSNPWVSLDPILAVPGIRQALTGKRVMAVSPIVAGNAVKGPAAKMFLELGQASSAVSVAEHYRGLVTDLVLDEEDAHLGGDVLALGIRPWVAHTLMHSPGDRRRLAKELLAFLAQRLPEGNPA